MGDTDYSAEEVGVTVAASLADDHSPAAIPDMAQASVSSGIVADSEGTAAPTQQSKLILLVEDNMELRRFLCDSLCIQYRVIEAFDGAHALKVLEEQLPDLIISDVMMPNLDGITFCKKVKENDALSHIPFMLLTAKDSPENRLEGVSHGADHYFAKPISMKLLSLTIHNIFTQHYKLKLRYLMDYRQEIRQEVHSATDQAFIDKVLGLLEEELENPDLNVEFLCLQMGMSQTKFYKRLKAVSGKNITEFIRTVRLKKAAYLMTHSDVTISEVMRSVGISSASYFTAAFKREFGKTPSQYQKEMELV